MAEAGRTNVKTVEARTTGVKTVESRTTGVKMAEAGRANQVIKKMPGKKIGPPKEATPTQKTDPKKKPFTKKENEANQKNRKDFLGLHDVGTANKAHEKSSKPKKTFGKKLSKPFSDTKKEKKQKKA